MYFLAFFYFAKVGQDLSLFTVSALVARFYTIVIISEFNISAYGGATLRYFVTTVRLRLRGGL